MRTGRWLLIGCLCLGAAGAAGCNGRLTPEAERLLSDGIAAYKGGDDARAVRSMDLFLRDHAASKRADEAYYYRGLAKYRSKNLAGAKADFQQALDRTREEAIRVGAKVALGDLAYDTGDMAAAEKAYMDALKDIERGEPPSDHVHYRLGRALQRQGRWREADSHFDLVVFLFEGTELARRSLRYVRSNAWTIQAGAFEDASRAGAVVAKLETTGLAARRQPTLRGEKLLFVVNVGRYETYPQAEADLQKVRRHYPDAFLTTTR